MNKVQEALAKNLKLNRLRLGITQEELAERCKLTPKFITAIEIGRRFPSAETFEALAKALGIEPYRLLLEEKDIEGFNREELMFRLGEGLKKDIGTIIDKRVKGK